MSTIVLTDVCLFIAEFDFTTEINEVSLTQEVEIPDATVFKSGNTRQYTPGLKGVAGTHHGWYDTSGVSGFPPPPGESLSGSGQFFEYLSTPTQLIGVHTILPEGGTTAGERAYFFEATQSRYSPNGSLGELFGFDIEFMPRGDLIGASLMDDAVTLHTASRTGTSQQLGAQTADVDKVYAALHVVEFDGTTLDINVRSDNDSGMAGATTRISFTQATAETSEGPLLFTAGTADDWWDVDLTFVGTNFRAVLVVGIQ